MCQAESTAVPVFTQFEKNYPKNVFLPILEYLRGSGLQEHYQQCVGFKQTYEGKNVVSLTTIHTLFAQKWFKSRVDQSDLLACVSNSIMLNSKIKRKMFHLKMMQGLIGLPVEQCLTFRKMLSHLAIECALQCQNVGIHEFMYFNSVIVYLLGVLLRELHKHLNEGRIKTLAWNQVQKMFVSEGGQLYGSKSDAKMLVKCVRIVLNSAALNENSLRILMKQMPRIIRHNEEQLEQQYSLKKHILNWDIFSTMVVQNCLQHSLHKKKLTDCLLIQWLHNFRDAVTRGSPQSTKNHHQNISYSQQLIQPIDESSSMKSDSSSLSIMKIFNPIVLISSTDNNL